MYGSYIIYGSYRVFSVQHLQKKIELSSTGPPGRGSFVFHELRHPPPKAMGDFSPWPKILGFLGLERQAHLGGAKKVRFRAPPWSSGKWGVM